MTSTDTSQTHLAAILQLHDLANVLSRHGAARVLWNAFARDVGALEMCAPVVKAWQAAKDSAGRERRPADPADPQRAETSRLAGLALEALSELDLAAAAARQS